MVSISEKLSRFAADLNYNNLPPEIIKQAKMCVIDCFSNMLASGVKFDRTILSKIINQLPECYEATVYGTFAKKSCMDAAFVNGIMARNLDIDDGNLEARGHPGTLLVPSILA